MNNDFTLQLVSAKSVLVIEGTPCAIWTYQMSWAAADIWRHVLGLPTAAPPANMRIAMELSRRISIQDPAQYPQIPDIQSTGVNTPTTGDVQFVYRDFQGFPTSPVEFSFIAPAAQDTFSPVKLLQRPAVETPWTILSFRVSPTGDNAKQQVITGPYPIGVAPLPSPPFAGALENSTRSLLKGTHVQIAEPNLFGLSARTKFSYVRQLGLQQGEVDAGIKKLDRLNGSPWTAIDLSNLAQLLHQFEWSSLPVQIPPVSALHDISVELLQSFGSALVKVREQSNEAATKNAPTQQSAVASNQRLQAAMSANKWLEATRTLVPTPIGMLNLERIEMAPAGIERGGLIATIPLAPGEKTAVVQKEWSVTSKEFTSIVTDSLENFSETGVTDNTELSQSTTSQIQHANQFNITGTVSGGIPLISGSSKSSFGLQDTNSQSATDSRKHALAVTQKASSRTKQEHKVTISTSTVTGTSETTTRELVNSSTTDPIRIDYFSLMRKWRVRLYRYGLRLTYDLVVPEPAGRLRQAYAELAALKAMVTTFEFPVTYSELSPDNNHYLDLAVKYGAQQIPSPPPRRAPFTHSDNPPAGSGWHFAKLDFEVPADSQIVKVHLFADIGVNESGKDPNLVVEGTSPLLRFQKSGGGPIDVDIPQFLVGATGSQTVFFNLIDVGPAFIALEIEVEPSADAIQRWKIDVWAALYSAAQTQYYAQQQDVAAKMADLEARLTNVDTLTLRREESDEIMRIALRFLLGTTYEYMNPFVDYAVQRSDGYIDPLTNQPVYTTDPEHGVAFTGSQVLINEIQQFLVSTYERDVEFINQAIEWENVVTFLYSYFWDMPESWNFIRQVQHPDANRQAFLRAGSARVVLTIRKGWEDAWLRYVDGIPLGQTTPRLTIAQEIAAYDDRNYPGIPPANPGQSAVRLEDMVYATSVSQLSPLAPTPQDPNPLPLTDVEIEVVTTGLFLVGAQVIIDSGVGSNFPPYTWGRQESTTLKEVRSAGNKLVLKLASIQCPHGGDNQSYTVVQPGEKGVLIAEWNEYTPTSGTDIAVTSNLATIA